MTTEDSKKEGTQKAGATEEETAPFEMMNRCCSGEGGFFDCTTMMKRMGTKGISCCGSGTDDSETDRRKK